MDLRAGARRMAVTAVALATIAQPASAQTTSDITFWFAVSGSQGEAVEALIEKFNTTNTDGIHVEGVFSGDYGETAQKLSAALTGGGLPDAGLVPAGPLWTCAEDNHLLAAYLEGEDGLPEDAFWPVLWDYNRYGEEVCALPFNNSTMVMYYNKDLMTQAGLDPETPPTTWAELAEQATAITSAVPGVIGVEVRDEAWWFKALVLQAGGQIMNADSSAPAFDSPEGLAALEYWKSLIDGGIMPPAQHADSRDLFIGGRVGFLMSSTASVATVTSGATFPFGTAWMPGNVKQGATVGGASLALFPSTPERQDAAWTFLKWLSSVENQIFFTTSTGYVPISPAAAASPEIQTLMTEQPAYRAGFEQLSIASQYPAFSAMGTMDALMAEMIEQVELGQKPPAQALADTSAAVVEEIAASAN